MELLTFLEGAVKAVKPGANYESNYTLNMITKTRYY